MFYVRNLNCLTFNPWSFFSVTLTQPLCGIVLCENIALNMDMCHHMKNEKLSLF